MPFLVAVANNRKIWNLIKKMFEERLILNGALFWILFSNKCEGSFAFFIKIFLFYVTKCIFIKCLRKINSIQCKMEMFTKDLQLLVNKMVNNDKGKMVTKK